MEPGFGEREAWPGTSVIERRNGAPPWSGPAFADTNDEMLSTAAHPAVSRYDTEIQSQLVTGQIMTVALNSCQEPGGI